MKTLNSTDSAAMAIRRITLSGKAVTAALLTLTVVLAFGGCSKKQTANSNQNVAAQAAGQVATIAPPAQATLTVPDVPKKKNVKGPVKKLPAFLTYNDEKSGVSFTYPRKSRLELGEKAEQDMVAEEQVPMNFVQTGGLMLAVVELPGVPKSGTDFIPSFFTASVSKGLTAEQCALFRSQEPKQDLSESDSSHSGETAQSSIPTLTVTLGGIEYAELDKLSEQQSVKYYHHFVSGSSPEDSECYEFGMAVRSADEKQDADKGSANSDTQQKDAFAKLEKILASVNIKSDVKPAVVEAAKADATSAETAKTEDAKATTKVDDNPR